MSGDQYAWGQEMVTPEGDMGLESFTAAVDSTSSKAPFFRPVNIIAEKGQYYVTLYACHLFSGDALTHSTALWLQTLKATDQVNLSVSSLRCGVPPSFMVDILGAILACKAKIVIYLDQVVMDTLAYFYFTADEIIKREGGAMFIPSYVANREMDMSHSSKSVHDVFKRLVDYAQERSILTEDEATKLHRGINVILPADRFAA